ncbi:MAG: DUF4391 domain-containing protein [Flavobacterium lindanitolerans]|uniref:DUF4391 domain-containing protein n=1 Tax=Flavobacterium lindanitolerans TaxID=428988 RepID=UPI001A4D0DE4|nr:DUF4391 domain-containing protein [Flavobacterium lindanitolerans]MBL7869734.1 DUF4391 domain-containing protein [Flavobacterium lindanitolerans]
MFNLPKSTLVQKVVPKNAFDAYTNSRQKKAFTEKIQRITWLNKISFETVNLREAEIKEIQIFKIELKEKTEIKDILNIIEKAIPYHIIFSVDFDQEFYISTSVKHLHPNDEDSAVIDYTFKSGWLNIADNPYKIELKNNLDWVFQNFCEQLKTVTTNESNIQALVQAQKQHDSLHREIEKLKSEIARCKQFNIKVELNMKLKELEKMLKF